MENEAFSQEDIFPYGMNHLYVHPYFSDETNGLIQSVKIDSGVISTKAMSTLKIQFNPNMTYTILITDPLLQFFNSNPNTVPRTILRMEKSAGYVTLFLKANIISAEISYPILYWLHYNLIQDTKYKKLNQADRQCNPTPEYNFAKCVHKSIYMNAGCQPHWRLFSVEGMPTCNNATMVKDFSMIWANM